MMCVLAGAVGGAAIPARADDLPPMRGDRPPFFTADGALTTSTQGQAGLALSVTIPYRELQWVRIPKGFAAGAEITVIIEPHTPGRDYGDFWVRRVVVPSFGATLSPNATVLEKRTFALPSGRYRVRVSIRDLNSGQESGSGETITVPDFTRIPVSFADLELGVVDSTGSFDPSATRVFGYDVSHLAARATLFDRRSGSWPRNYSLRYRILDETGDEIVGGNRPATLAKSGQAVQIQPSSSDLFLGTYTFEVSLVEGRSRWKVDRSFEVEESGPPHGKEFERLLEVLAYIADPREIEALRALPPDQQARGWDEFWKRRDPTPDTARNEAMIEFFRRVRYAEHHFQGAGPGWRSDMGRIYIKFGPPDQIENRAATSQSPQLEVWYYNNPYRRLVFEDRDGFGRYVLVSPASE